MILTPTSHESSTTNPFRLKFETIHLYVSTLPEWHPRGNPRRCFFSFFLLQWVSAKVRLFGQSAQTRDFQKEILHHLRPIGALFDGSPRRPSSRFLGSFSLVIDGGGSFTKSPRCTCPFGCPRKQPQPQTPDVCLRPVRLTGPFFDGQTRPVRGSGFGRLRLGLNGLGLPLLGRLSGERHRATIGAPWQKVGGWRCNCGF